MGDFSNNKHISDSDFKRSLRVFLEITPPLISRGEIRKVQKEEEPKVILTIKEAKEILQSSYDVLSWSTVGPTHKDNALYVQKLLKYRIEQAEMSMQST